MLAMIGQVLPEPFWQRVTPAPVDALEGPSRLLLDSRVVDVPMSYHPIVMTLSSVKPFFVNGLNKAWRSSDNVGAEAPGLQ